MWVKLILPPRARRRWLLITTRLSAMQLGRHRAHAGGGRDVQRGLHVGDDARGRAAQRGVPASSAGVAGGAGAVRPCRSRPAGFGSGGLRAGRRLGRRRLRRPGFVGAVVSAGGRWLGRRRLRAGGPRRGVGRRRRRRLPASSAGLGRGASAAPVRPAVAAARPVVGEEVVPRGVDAVRVGQVALVHVLDEPLVGAEVAAGGWGRFAASRLLRRRHVVRPSSSRCRARSRCQRATDYASRPAPQACPTRRDCGRTETPVR